LRTSFLRFRKIFMRTMVTKFRRGQQKRDSTRKKCQKLAAQQTKKTKKKKKKKKRRRRRRRRRRTTTTTTTTTTRKTRRTKPRTRTRTTTRRRRTLWGTMQFSYELVIRIYENRTRSVSYHVTIITAVRPTRHTPRNKQVHFLG